MGAGAKPLLVPLASLPPLQPSPRAARLHSHIQDEEGACVTGCKENEANTLTLAIRSPVFSPCFFFCVSEYNPLSTSSPNIL